MCKCPCSPSPIRCHQYQMVSSVDCSRCRPNHSCNLQDCWPCVAMTTVFSSALFDCYWDDVIGLFGRSANLGIDIRFRECLCKAVLARKATESPIRLVPSEILGDSVQLVQQDLCLSYIGRLIWNHWPSSLSQKAPTWGATAMIIKVSKVRMPAPVALIGLIWGNRLIFRIKRIGFTGNQRLNNIEG